MKLLTTQALTNLLSRNGTAHRRKNILRSESRAALSTKLVHRMWITMWTGPQSPPIVQHLTDCPSCRQPDPLFSSRMHRDSPVMEIASNRLAKQDKQRWNRRPRRKVAGKRKGTLGGGKNLRNRRPFNAADTDPLLGHGDQRLNPGFDGGQSLRQRGSLAIGGDHQE